MKHTLEHISKLQIPTWSWLNINDTSVDMDFTGMEAYGKNPLIEEYKGLRLERENMAGSSAGDFRTSGGTEGIREFVKKHKNGNYYISIEKDQVIEKPVVLDFVLDKENALLVEEVLIEAGEGSKAAIILKYSSAGDEECIHCGYTRLNIKKGAEISLTKVQAISENHIHVDATEVNVEEAAKGNVILAELGAKEAVSTCNVCLTGEESRIDIDNIYIGNKSRKMDMNYRIEYDGKNTEGYITAKGVLLDSSRKVSKNTLDFMSGSSGSKGREEEAVIVLSETAVNVSTPVLLCAEDNVEGNHASSTGKPDGNKLYYLMSRGLSENEAKKLLVEASFAPIINKIPLEALREQISLYTSEVIQHGE